MFAAGLDSPFNPFARWPMTRQFSAACQVFEGMTRRYGKPTWNLPELRVGGWPATITPEVAQSLPFCDLLHFRREGRGADGRSDPKVLVIAPMSGHYATLLRATVLAMLPEHDVYITDWHDARYVPAAVGPWGFADFVDTLIDQLRHLGPGTHVMGVCQPAVPALVAAAVMAAAGDAAQPASLILMGGPIDTRRNPTAVNAYAATKPLSWFSSNVIYTVPFPYPGVGRRVYPGFVQLSGFMAMNFERHMNAHRDFFDNLVVGDCDSIQQHRTFYDEYLSVMDLPAEFFLETVTQVFKEHSLPDGRMMHRGQPVDCSAIRGTALMTVEGERDDICGLGQTEAAHALCTGIPPERHVHYMQPGVGHYGVFNGTRWRTEIQPRIAEFIRMAERPQH